MKSEEEPSESPQKTMTITITPLTVILTLTSHTSVKAVPADDLTLSRETQSCQAAGLSNGLREITCISKTRFFSTGFLHDNPHASELPKRSWKLSNLTRICSYYSPESRQSKPSYSVLWACPVTIALWWCMRLQDWWISGHLAGTPQWKEVAETSIACLPPKVSDLRRKNL